MTETLLTVSVKYCIYITNVNDEKYMEVCLSKGRKLALTVVCMKACERCNAKVML
jgi:hypothetical protein